MIIKLIPIKTKARLDAVIHYIASDKGRIEDYLNQGIFHNVKNIDLEDLRKEFEHNYDEYAGKRSNGNIAMHIIQSVSPLDRDKMNLEIMDELSSIFLNKAYPNALGFGTHHKEQSHWHTHTIVSANEFMSKTSTRLSKEKLFEVHKFMLDHIHEKYPELKTSIDISNWGKKFHNEKEYYMKKRNPDLKLSKEELQEKVQDIFRMSESSKQFYQLLEFDGFITYNYKDRVQGIHLEGDDRKMRFSRLGIEHEQLDELDKQYNRLQELEKLNMSVKILTLDHYSYEELRDSKGSPTAIGPDFDMKMAEVDERLLDDDFAKIMDLPIYQDEKVIDTQNESRDIEEEAEQDNNIQELDIEKESQNDINELEHTEDKDIDTDNDLDLDSEL